ncbi:DUF3168 domain-containing protein [Planococcus koreensis]|uniref:DUF3168 domain-containing protein n=1 Tax=Planococcus koreensis TaxID=112331 RepID=UPI0039FD891B
MAIKTALWPFQNAVFQRLSEDPLISGMTTGVYDAVEEDLVHPYITIGEPTEDPFETKNTYSEELALVIHVWSIYSGKKEAYDILNAIVQAIGKGLSIEGPFTLLNVEKPRLNVIDDVNPQIKHGIARLKVTIKNN